MTAAASHILGSIVNVVLQERSDVNSISSYPQNKTDTLRILAIVSCSLSLLLGLLFFYVYFSMHHSRLQFRHRLIFILLLFDTLKSLSGMIYPIISFHGYPSQKTINFLGFFTALSIEGSDLAILAFAIHTCVTVFGPKRKVTYWQYFYYASTVVIPVILACIPFAFGGYTVVEAWCYLPSHPVWLRIGLSYGPRLVIIITIITIYSTIYFYVMRQLKKMDCPVTDPEILLSHQSKWWSLNRYLNSDVKKDEDQKTSDIPIDPHATKFDINIQLQMNNNQRLKERYRVISRQIKAIFLYPASYVFIWIFPFIANGLSLTTTKRIYGLDCIVVFMTPFNSAVDFVVFLIRETPWKYTYSTVEKSPFSPVDIVPTWRYKLRFLPLYHLTEEMIRNYENNLSAGAGTGATNTRQATYNGSRNVSSAKQSQLKSGVFSGSTNVDEFLKKQSFSSSVAYEYQKDSDESTKRPFSSDDSNLATNENNDDEEDEMDLLEFLNRGPA